MPRGAGITSLPIALLLLACLACNRVALERTEGSLAAPPNVLLVTVDTLRADHVGAYGARDARTPAMDRLAGEGVRFARAMASAPLTLPSHASILTGLYPPAAGVRHNGLYRLAPELDTLTERLQSAGYATGAFVGSFVLAARFGLDQGFEVYDDEMPPVVAGPGGFLERRAEAVTDRTLAWLAGAPEPFFAWVHYYDPHAVYRPPPPFDQAFAERPYAGEIAYVDAQLGRLLARLGRDGRLERTLVAVTADHGESLGEHDEVDHGYALYDAVLAVPLLLRGPGLPRGRVVEEVVRTVDLAPTLLEHLALAPLAGVDGRDLAPLWQGSAEAPRAAYAETLATRIEVGWSPLHALRTARYHYVRSTRPELYDVGTDPGQLVNLLERDPERARPVAAELDAQVERVLARAREDEAAAVDAETLARLRALGYALPDAPPVASVPGEALPDPKDGRRAFGLLSAATEAYAADQLERAVTLVTRALEQMPGSSRAHALLGFIELHRARPQRALAPLERAARLNPRSAYYRAMLGSTREQLGDLEGALRDYRAAAVLDAAEPYAQIGLMGAALREGDLAAAERHASAAHAAAPADVVLLLRIGDTWSGAGQHGRGGAAYEAAVRIDPGVEYGQMRLAIALARFGRESASDVHRARAGRLAHEPPLVHLLAQAYAAAGLTARAEREWRALLARTPGFAPARRALAGLPGGAPAAPEGP